MNYNKWSDSHSKWPNSDVWWDPHIYAFYEINSAAVTGTGFKLPGSFPAESVPSSDVRYIQKAELQWRRHAVSCQATERGACRCRSVYRQVPKNLHPGWKVGHLKKKKKEQRGQQLTSLWLNIKHMVGLHFGLQKEGHTQRVPNDISIWFPGLKKKKKTSLPRTHGQLIHLNPVKKYEV